MGNFCVCQKNIEIGDDFCINIEFWNYITMQSKLKTMSLKSKTKSIFQVKNLQRHIPSLYVCSPSYLCDKGMNILIWKLHLSMSVWIENKFDKHFQEMNWYHKGKNVCYSK